MSSQKETNAAPSRASALLSQRFVGRQRRARRYFTTRSPLGAVGTDACVTVMVCPATVSVPVLGGVAVAAAVNETVPDPVPVAPPVICSHTTLAVAVQLQPDAVVTVMLVFPPAA